MRCPKCRTLTLVPAGVDGDACRLVRCPRCTATWLSRPGEDLRHRDPERTPMVRKTPLTIEGDLAPPRRRRRWDAMRTGLFATVAIAILALATVMTLSPQVSAGPEMAPVGASR